MTHSYQKGDRAYAIIDKSEQTKLELIIEPIVIKEKIYTQYPKVRLLEGYWAEDSKGRVIRVHSNMVRPTYEEAEKWFHMMPRVNFQEISIDLDDPASVEKLIQKTKK